MSKFIDFSDGKALMVNNAEWLRDLNYIEFIRDIGAHFSVNRMLTAECYKQRMEKGLQKAFQIAHKVLFRRDKTFGD